MKNNLFIVFLAVLIFGCATDGVLTSNETDIALHTWNEGKVKNDIITYLNEITDPGSNGYIEEKDRIVVFDLDGTLITEKPYYFEVMVALERLKEEVGNSPELRDVQPYKAAVENDSVYIKKFGDLIVEKAANEETIASYQNRVRGFFTETKHPKYNQLYDALFYKPMVELISLLKDIGFEVYVVSTSQQEYIREFADSCLGIDKSNVIGTMIEFKLDGEINNKRFIRTDKVWDPLNADIGKVYRIRERTGSLPVLAFGNSYGDKQMLEVTALMENGKSFLLDHDDSEREYKYHKDGMLEDAKKNGWTIISMKDDFKYVHTNVSCLTKIP